MKKIIFLVNVDSFLISHRLEIAKELLHASPSGDIWLAAATAESMGSPYCDPDNFDCGSGGDAENILNGKTSSAPCGSSFKLTIGKLKFQGIDIIYWDRYVIKRIKAYFFEIV